MRKKVRYYENNDGSSVMSGTAENVSIPFKNVHGLSWIYPGINRTRSTDFPTHGSDKAQYGYIQSVGGTMHHIPDCNFHEWVLISAQPQLLLWMQSGHSPLVTIRSISPSTISTFKHSEQKWLLDS
ncbi:uncharacterized protein LACBIDRAFT_323137 [Laccaria bicolor S238N-H82]|uniref:Predicted protein n=1 Tax=Laccaria bicolor (strain S238N-H82 / ATCC MYA-4686) TaxID=486041 RepID=B0CZ87_LACBS|nr:uncharacterized protein LACBIDRAFT_323137 [Laccaria bicolor S238N-H82]EDR12576.1 predicted protein [Laccaria bicolor S238N-H82]|eukprot:XP_001876840.1 predicted protein [Laccaria bicolor S238N-H82]